METVWAVQHLCERPEDAYMLEKKDHGHCNTTSYDIWSRDMVTHKTLGRETCSDSEKHGKINAEYNVKRQDQEHSHMIKDKSERHYRERL